MHAGLAEGVRVMVYLELWYFEIGGEIIMERIAQGQGSQLHARVIVPFELWNFELWSLDCIYMRDVG